MFYEAVTEKSARREPPAAPTARAVCGPVSPPPGKACAETGRVERIVIYICQKKQDPRLGNSPRAAGSRRRPSRYETRAPTSVSVRTRLISSASLPGRSCDNPAST